MEEEDNYTSHGVTGQCRRPGKVDGKGRRSKPGFVAYVCSSSKKLVFLKCATHSHTRACPGARVHSVCTNSHTRIQLQPPPPPSPPPPRYTVPQSHRQPLCFRKGLVNMLHTPIHIYTHTYVYIHMCIHTYVYMHMYVCIYNHLQCIYTHLQINLKIHPGKNTCPFTTLANTWEGTSLSSLPRSLLSLSVSLPLYPHSFPLSHVRGHFLSLPLSLALSFFLPLSRLLFLSISLFCFLWQPVFRQGARTGKRCRVSLSGVLGSRSIPPQSRPTYVRYTYTYIYIYIYIVQPR
jgi:hypothetical protein